MIIDPDFLDHWRTRMVVDALGGDEMAPMYIMRLWGHCQARKADRHAMPPAGLKAQCRAPHDAALFEQALTDAGFVVRDGDTIVVLGWAEQNASLIAAWENGGKGGRPRKKPTQNPRVPDQKPTGNPAETHGQPDANQDETQAKPIREEKSRGDVSSDDETHTERVSIPAAVCLAMKARGMGDVNPSHPDLLALIDGGTDIGLFSTAAAQAVDKGKGFAYALGIVRGQLADAQRLADTVRTAPPKAQRSSFAAQDREHGMQRWEQMTGRTHPDRAAPAGVVIDMPTHQLATGGRQ